MRKLLLLVIICSSTMFGQEIKKKEITNSTLKDHLFIVESSNWGGPYKEQFEDNFEKNKKLYIFEMEYQGEVFYRGSIDKEIAKGNESALFSNLIRFKSKFIVPYDIFDQATKLDMLERGYIVHKDDGVRYLYYQDFEPIKSDGGSFIINPEVPEYIKLRIYELEFM